MVKTRFAPSPTGMLHVGGLRTALYAYLFARKHGGRFMLRIEDTDQERFVEGGIENIVHSLKWAGLQIDEGVFVDESGSISQKGENGPYIQSERLDIYRKHVDELVEKGHAYYCFCSKERLDELRKEQEMRKLPTMYDGKCKTLSIEEKEKNLSDGLAYVIRMNMPKEGETSFGDMIRGEVKFQNKLIDDQVLLKSDGFPTYHLAVVVDDHFMGTTHVFRGEEWLPSTPKHIMLYQMFGWEAPQFAHLSLLVNEQKQKLSKRHGDVSVRDFEEKGYLPEAMVNFVAFLGWNPGDDREIFSLSELEQAFSAEKISKAAAVFNREKLNWFNKEYMKKMDIDELVARACPFFTNCGYETEETQLREIILLERERVNTLAELPEAVSFIFANELTYPPELLIWKKDTREGSKMKLELLRDFILGIPKSAWAKDQLEAEIGEWIASKGFSVGEVLWPMRVALSGKQHSPGPFEIAAVLGKDKCVERIDRAAQLL